MKSVFVCVICVTLSVATQARTVTTSSLRDEVNTFLGKELAVHLAAIKSLDPPRNIQFGLKLTF